MRISHNIFENFIYQNSMNFLTQKRIVPNFKNIYNSNNTNEMVRW